jgi:4-oxalocrotonate tautomerase
MPHVSIKLYPGRSLEQKRALADRIVEAMGETIDARPEHISVTFEEVPPEEWDDRVVKPDIVEKLDSVIKMPDYRSEYLEGP